MELVYTPRNNLLDELVNITTKKLGFSKYTGIDDHGTFIKKLVFGNYLAGIIFHGNWLKATEYPRTLNFSLVFPVELRAGVSLLGRSWLTQFLLSPEITQGPRNGAADDGGTPVGYYREGFTAIQHTLSMTYIEKIKTESFQSRSNKQLPKVYMQRLAFPAYHHDFLLYKIENIYALLTIISVILPITQLVLVSSLASRKNV